MSILSYNPGEIRDLLAPVIDLVDTQSTGYYDVKSVDSNGYHHRTETYPETHYYYKLGQVKGREWYTDEQFEELYTEAFKTLGLNHIIQDYAPNDDEWYLCDQWEAGTITITTEALRYLYFTESESLRLNILERAVDVTKELRSPVIDANCIRLCREAMQINGERHA